MGSGQASQGASRRDRSETSGSEGMTTERGRDPVAVALTVKSEGPSIRCLLDALFEQTSPPAEVVIADGGSEDETVPVIQAYIARGRPVRLIEAPGACRGRGRNLAIAASRHEIVALIDGGCLPEPAWLERLAAELEAPPAKDVVFGIVRPLADSVFTECVSTALFPAAVLTDGRRAMTYSVASMIMRRRVWEKVGGFVEGLRTGEDVIFVGRIKESDLAVGVAGDAMVHWEIPRTLGGTIQRLANYSHYTLEAGLGRTWHHRAFLNYAATLFLAALGVFHSPWWLVLLAALFAVRVVKTILTNEKERRGLGAFTGPRLLLVGAILLAADFATLYGTMRWLRSVLVARLSVPISRLNA